jgi:very-short-patch-repair endonuclease
MVRENEYKCHVNRAENWMRDKLITTKSSDKWIRQKDKYFRIFDFYNSILGIAVEVDGDTHNPIVDNYRDTYAYYRHSILVLRVPNFDEKISSSVIRMINKALTWQERADRLREIVPHIWTINQIIQKKLDIPLS